MKKIVITFVAIILTTSLLFAFAGCSESFSKNSIMSEINNNLGWHEGGTEVCTYNVTAGDAVIGEYTSKMQSLFNQNVEITTSSDSSKPKLNNFTGYKFTSEITAQLDGKTFVKKTESYASHRLEPKLSYVKTIEDNVTIEIITSYEEKKCNVTFIKDGKVEKTDSTKYSKSAFVVDNSFLYQFARATTLSNSVSIVVPTYNASSCNAQSSSYSCSYASATNIVLANKFIINKKFNQTIASGDSGEINSGAINVGSADKSGDITTSDADASGNVTVTYPHTLTSSIPVVKCTFTTSKTFPSSGSISCMIASADMKMQGDSRFASRVIVRFQEGNIVYNLTSVKYTL